MSNDSLDEIVEEKTEDVLKMDIVKEEKPQPSIQA